MQLLGMLMQSQQQAQAQKNWQDQFANTQQQQTVQDELARGHLLETDAARRDRVNEVNAYIGSGRYSSPERTALLKQAMDAAYNGVDVDTSGLSPNEAQMVESVKKTANDQQTQLFNQASGAAEALNRPLRALNSQKVLQGSVKDWSDKQDAHLNPLTWGRALYPDDPAYTKDANDLKTVSDSLPDLQAQAAQVHADPTLKGLVTFDGRTGLYVPAVQPPKTLKRGALDMGTTTANPQALGPVRDASTNPDWQMPAMPGETSTGTAAQQAKGRNKVRYIQNGNNIFQVMPDGSFKFVKETGNYSEGGPVKGKGTSTSDNIPARLSPNEFVLPAETMEIPGMMQAANKMRNMGLAMREARKKPVRMAMGGFPGMGGGGFNPMAMLMPMMGGGMGGDSSGGGFNMMMPWLSLLSQPKFFNNATGNKAFKFADGGMVPDFADNYSSGGLGGFSPGADTMQPLDYQMAAYGPSSGAGGTVNALGGTGGGSGSGINWIGMLMQMFKARRAQAAQGPPPVYNFGMPRGQGSVYSFGG